MLSFSHICTYHTAMGQKLHDYKRKKKKIYLVKSSNEINALLTHRKISITWEKLSLNVHVKIDNQIILPEKPS